MVLFQKGRNSSSWLPGGLSRRIARPFRRSTRLLQLVRIGKGQRLRSLSRGECRLAARTHQRGSGISAAMAVPARCCQHWGEQTRKRADRITPNLDDL